MFDDKIMLRSLKEGNEKAFLQIYDKYVGKIFNFISYLLGDKVLAEDFTQDCFMKVWKNRARIDEDANFEAYLYTIARNSVYHETRKRLLASKYAAYKSLVSSGWSTESTDKLTEREISDRLQKIISTFPKAMRRIYDMNTKEGKQPSQIAYELGLSVKTVDAQLYKARTLIKKMMKDFLSFLLFL